MSESFPSSQAAPAQRPGHVVVIGAGVSGLMSAWALQRKGWRVTLLERDAELGGVVRTRRLGGYQAECGPNSMMVSSAAFEALLSELGLEAQAVRANKSFKKRFIVRDGRLHAAPASFGEFAKTPIFSWRGKLGLFGDLLWGAGTRRDLQDESMGSYFRRHFGSEVVDYAINPIVAGVYAGDPERLSMRHAFAFLHEASQRSRSILRGVILNMKDKRKRGERFRSYLLNFRDGLGALPAAIAAKLDTPPLTGVTLTAIRQVPPTSVSPLAALGGTACGWEIDYRTGAPADAAVATAATATATTGANGSVVGSGATGNADNTNATTATRTAAAVQMLHADALVLAVPAHVLSQLPLPPQVSASLAPLSQIEHPPVASVALGYRREQVAHALDGFGALIPAKEKTQVLGVLFSSSMYPSTAPQGRVLVTAFIGGSRSPQLAQLGAAELVSHAHNQLAPLLDLKGEPEFSHVTRWRKAIPQLALGYETFFAAMENTEQRWPTLALCGNYRGQIAVAKCAVDAFERAEAFSARLCDRQTHQG